MAAVTETTGPFVLALGPIKVEILDAASVDDGDTYTCRLQRPLFGAFILTTDNNSTAESVNVGISGKTITFNNSALSSDTGILVLVGF